MGLALSFSPDLMQQYLRGGRGIRERRGSVEDASSRRVLSFPFFHFSSFDEHVRPSSFSSSRTTSNTNKEAGLIQGNTRNEAKRKGSADAKEEEGEKEGKRRKGVMGKKGERKEKKRFGRVDE